MQSDSHDEPQSLRTLHSKSGTWTRKYPRNDRYAHTLCNLLHIQEVKVMDSGINLSNHASLLMKLHTCCYKD